MRLWQHKSKNLEHILSYNASKNTIIYAINRKISRFQLHEEDDVQSISMRACYDIRSPQLWTLENFNTLLQMKLDSIQIKTLSLQFVIQDSTGKVKDAYPNPQKTSLSSPEYKQPLGFISGDML